MQAVPGSGRAEGGLTDDGVMGYFRRFALFSASETVIKKRLSARFTPGEAAKLRLWGFMRACASGRGFWMRGSGAADDGVVGCFCGFAYFMPMRP